MGSRDTSVASNAGGNGSGVTTTTARAATSTGDAPEIARPNKPLAGKVALVTGASRGIGRAIAIALGEAGAMVAVNYNSSAAEAKAVEELIIGSGSSALSIQADVSQSSAVRAMMERAIAEFGRIDILVNNSGITRDRTVHKLKEEDWLAVINTNLNSVFYCTAAVVPGMIERKWGRIINVSSMTGATGNFGQTNYAAAKGGVIAFTKAAALELARHGVTVNSIAPGFTETDMAARIPEDIKNQIKDRIPAKRFARPEEMAEAAVFLAAHGDYITGQVIHVNGGMYM